MNTLEAVKQDLTAALEKFKELIKGKRKFADAKLSDGTIIRIDGETEAGAAVFVIDENGETPAPDGEHTLEDGTILVVAEGKIAEVKKAEQEEEMSEEFDAKAAIEGLTKAYEERISALESLIGKQAEAMKSQEETMEKTKEVQGEVFKLIEKILDTPTEAPTQKKDSFKKAPSIAEARKAFQEDLKKLSKGK